MFFLTVCERPGAKNEWCFLLWIFSIADYIFCVTYFYHKECFCFVLFVGFAGAVWPREGSSLDDGAMYAALVDNVRRCVCAKRDNQIEVTDIVADSIEIEHLTNDD